MVLVPGLIKQPMAAFVECISRIFYYVLVSKALQRAQARNMVLTVGKQSEAGVHIHFSLLLFFCKK